jgi:hypothetical protein
MLQNEGSLRIESFWTCGLALELLIHTAQFLDSALKLLDLFAPSGLFQLKVCLKFL